MIVLSAIWAVLAALVSTPVLSDLWSAIRPRRRSSPAVGGARLTVLVPAHNEERLLGSCLDALAQAGAGLAVSVVVLADNCTDGTAAVAASKGVRCLERHDEKRRGKPAAIAWALGRGVAADSDAVVVVDADTLVEPGFLHEVSANGPWAGAAGQGRQVAYGSGRSWLLTLSALFMDVRYGIIFPLKERSAVNCPLTGSGMVFGSDLPVKEILETAGPAEDMEMYGRFTAHGTRVRYLQNARVLLLVEGELKDSRTQRRRWAAGRIIAIRRYLGAILANGRTSVGQKLDSVAELVFPGPVVTLLIALPLAAAAWVFGFPGRLWLVLALALPILRIAAYTLVACWRSPHPIDGLAALAMLPVYAVWRLTVAVSAAALLRAPRWEGTTRRRDVS